MTPKSNKTQFPLWKFLTQPIFDAKVPFVLSPKQFWHVHQIGYLERCWRTVYRPEENFHS
ncbi:MAG TPA: hypothetical protein V6C84_19980 [Coleofasciculaceae cyanobacterium]